jgi:hypothetical protein
MSCMVLEAFSCHNNERFVYFEQAYLLFLGTDYNFRVALSVALQSERAGKWPCVEDGRRLERFATSVEERIMPESFLGTLRQTAKKTAAEDLCHDLRQLGWWVLFRIFTFHRLGQCVFGDFSVSVCSH